MPRTRMAFSLLVAGVTVLGASFAAERKEFQDWPAGTSPREVGKRVAENFAGGPFERPTRYVIYPEVRAWYGSLTLAQLTGDADLRDRLVRKFDPSLQQPNGLFFHAPDSPYYWSRGKGWMAAGRRSCSARCRRSTRSAPASSRVTGA